MMVPRPAISTVPALRRLPRLRLSRRKSGFAGGLAVFIGLVLLIDAIITVAWEDPFTTVFTQHAQKVLGKKLAAAEQAPLPASTLELVKRAGSEQERMAVLGAHERLTAAGGGPTREDLHPEDRQELRVHRRHGGRSPEERPRPLCGHRAARRARNRRDRRASDDVRRSVPSSRQAAPRLRHHPDDALRNVHLQRGGIAVGAARPDDRPRQHPLRAARSDDLYARRERRQAPCRDCPAEAGSAPRLRDPAGPDCADGASVERCKPPFALSIDPLWRAPAAPCRKLTSAA